MMIILYFFLGILFIYVAQWLQSLTDILSTWVSYYANKKQKEINDMFADQQELSPQIGFVTEPVEEYYEEE